MDCMVNTLSQEPNFVNIISSSLLIVYEGDSTVPHITVTKSDCCSEAPYCENECTQESEDNSRDMPCSSCYDADTSNSSVDFNSSHEEVSQELHHKGFGEAAAKGAKFCPISEETVFLDSPPAHPSPSPISIDSWVVYSNSSSDEYSLSQFNDGGSSNDEDTSDFETNVKTTKHSCTLQFAELELEDEDDEELTPTVSHKNITKRLRVKERVVPSTSNVIRSRSPAPLNVDVRMIDFAHTSFMAKSADAGAAAVLHQGPDGGFLTGLDSLKRLLSQILAEG